MKVRPQRMAESDQVYLDAARQYARRVFNKLREQNSGRHHASFDVRDALLKTEKRFCDLGTFGVESIIHSGDYQGPEICYLNTGDGYDLTLLYNWGTGRFQIGCWADLVEKHSH